MAERKSLSKKLRFEVFKRDSFKCQYCGKSAPNVVLEVDHVEPVASGGGNELFNLVTSCWDCNRGKSNRELQDDSVISKQRLQLELLQERREQIQSMFQWKKSLQEIDNDLNQMVVDYIEEKIDNISLNANGIKRISSLTKKYEFADILESVDLSAEKYIHYDHDGDVTHESAENFINKIGGILANKNKSPIEQKASYIKGICRNRFGYWNPTTGSIILNQYISALRDHGYGEEEILNDLENEVMPKTKQARNWTEWKNLIEQWTADIKAWKDDAASTEHEPVDYDEISDELFRARNEIAPALCYMGKPFEDFDLTEQDILERIDEVVFEYLTELSIFMSSGKVEGVEPPSFYKVTYRSQFFYPYGPINSMLTYKLDEAVRHLYHSLADSLEDYLGEPFLIEEPVYVANRYKNLISDSLTKMDK